MLGEITMMVNVRWDNDVQPTLPRRPLTLLTQWSTM